jgi:hypothetical protein
LRIEVGAEYGGALAGQQERRGSSDPGGSAGDEGDLAGHPAVS